MEPEPLLRLYQIIGRKAGANTPAISAIIPVSRTTWWAGIRSGRYPPPVRIGERCIAWRAGDIAQLLATLSAKEVAK